MTNDKKQEIEADLPELKTVKDLRKEWDLLPENERTEIYNDFQDDCIDGSSEPSDYWYELLMPIVMEGYVGD